MARPALAPSPEILAPMELFRGLDPAALGAVLERAQLRRLSKGAHVFSQGDTSDRCHALIGGRIRITQTGAEGHQIVVRFIGPGEMFGTIGIFTDHRYPADATAIEESVEISWSEASLRTLMRHHPEIALNALAVVGRRLQETQERLRELATERVERRVARAVMRLCRQAGRTTGDGIAIDLPLTRQDIGELTGTTLHTVSRILAAWEQQGLLESSHRHLLVRDLPAIERVAEDLVG